MLQPGYKKAPRVFPPAGPSKTAAELFLQQGAEVVDVEEFREIFHLKGIVLVDLHLNGSVGGNREVWGDARVDVFALRTVRNNGVW